MADAELPVTLYGTYIGELTRTGDRAFLRWSDEAEQRWGLNSPALSYGLRVGSTSTDQSEAFFGALLPEGNGLNQLARRAGAASNDLIGIFDAVGADLAGALAIGRRGEREADIRLLDDDELAETVRNAHGFIVGGGGSAVAGIQNKVALTRIGDQWAIGNDSTPSTHILKPVASDNSRAVQAESYALALGRALGLVTFDSWIETIDGQSVLVVERYDRAERDGAITRVHQEDLAQALSLPWGGNDKFQWDNAAANLAAVASTLDQARTIFSTGESDRQRLLRYLTINVAVGNTDAHAKDYSILRPDGTTAAIAPLYDIAPVMLGYEASKRLAMYIDDEQWLPNVTVDHLAREATRWGGGPGSLTVDSASEVIADTLERLVAATEETPADASIEATVPGFVRGQAKNLLAGKRAELEIRGPLAFQQRIDSTTHN